MAVLDYAYLADFAAVQDGKLNTIGASFTYLRTSRLPATHMMSVAGRVRSTVDEDSVSIGVKILPPDDAYEVEMSGVLTAGPEHAPYGDGKVGLLFALNTQVPLLSTGLYKIEITLGDELVRTLAFEVQVPVS